MAKYSIEESTLTEIGDAIRAKEGSTDSIPVTDLASRITAISSGGYDEYEIVKANAHTSNNAKISVINLPKEQYGYLLNCNALMLYAAPIQASDYWTVVSGICTIGSDLVNDMTNNVFNHATLWKVDLNTYSELNTSMSNAFSKISVSEDAYGVSIEIELYSKDYIDYRFTTASTYYITGFTI